MTAADRRLLYCTAGFIAACVLVYALRGMLLPFIAAVLIAYVLDPAASRLQKLGVPRGLAAVLLVTMFLVVVILFFFLFVPLVQSELSQAAAKIPDYVVALRDKAEALSFAIQRRLSEGDADKLRDAVSGVASDVITWLAGMIKRIFSGSLAVFNFLSLVFLTPLIAFYMLRDWHRILARIDSWLPRRSAPTVRRLAREIDSALSGFVRGQATVCLILATFYGIALTAIGLDFGVIVALIVGFLSFVPYLGTITGFVLSIGLAAAQFGTWGMIAVTAGIFLFGQIVEGNFLSPRIVGHRVGLHDVWVIFALLAGGELLGFLGVLLAVPAGATIGVLLRFALTRYRESAYYRSETGVTEGE